MKYKNFKPAALSIMELPAMDRPREKLEAKGSSALSDVELLMVMLSSGSQGHRVTELADELLALLDTNPNPAVEEISRINGIGKAKASVIAAALELGRRRINRNGRLISSPSDIFAEVRHYASREQEQFIVLVLNGAHEVINIFTATIGLVNRTLIHPREVFSDPIARRATAIAICHNHPSGVLTPSDEDVSTTLRLVEAGKLLGIKILDHLIFSQDEYFSLLEHGYM